MSPLLILLSGLALLLLSLPADAARPRHLAKDDKADAPAPSPSGGGDGGGGGSDIEEILEKNGNFKAFIRLLDDTRAGEQIENQLKNSEEGMTVFAPNDNAFNNLKSGTVNDLTPQQKTQLVQSHIVPKYYNLTTLQDVSNPVQTQATGQKGQLWGLNVTSQNNQVNVSSGDVVSPVNNALTKGPPLMVFEVNQVLLPEELFSGDGAKNATGDGGGDGEASPPPGAAEEEDGSTAAAPAGAPKASGASRGGLGLGLAAWLGGLLVVVGLL